MVLQAEDGASNIDGVACCHTLQIACPLAALLLLDL